MNDGAAHLDAYVARQTATVGRSATVEVKNAPPASPIGKLVGASGPCLGIIDGYEKSYRSGGAGAVGFAPDGRSVYYGRDDGRLHRWALPSGALVWAARGGAESGILSLSASPDGRRIATCHKDKSARVYDADSGNLLWERIFEHQAPCSVSFSPDGNGFAVAGSSASATVLDPATGTVRRTLEGSLHAYGVAWSPKGTHIAVGAMAGEVIIWDAESGRRVASRNCHGRDVNGIAWSPDGTRVASASEDRDVCLWSFQTGQMTYLRGHTQFLWSVAWSPEGKRIASGGNDFTIRIWDADRGTELAVYEFPEGFPYRMAFSPDGALLASSHPCTARLWDTRDTLKEVAPAPRLLASGPLPADLAPLPAALVALLRVSRSAPLSLLRDLLLLTGGRCPRAEAEPLAGHPGMQALISLHWPIEARIALALVLLREYEDESFFPPDGAVAAELRFRLLDGLAGAPCEAKAPPLPIALLLRALDSVDDRLLALLTSLGPEACADDPTLPLALLSRLDEMAPRIAVDRRLLDLRVPTSSLGAAEAKGPWLEPSGFSSSGSVSTIVPSQWALPEDVRRYRAATGGLLHRARFGREPPRLRPLVLVLDVSPATFGPVEAMLRSAAHALAASLLEAQIPGYIVAAGGQNEARPLLRRADLFELLTARARAPVQVGQTILLAQELLSGLPSGGPFPPAVVLLSHPHFGAEDEVSPWPAELSGLFVHYPGHPAEPALRRRLKRSICIGPGDEAELPAALGQVLS